MILSMAAPKTDRKAKTVEQTVLFLLCIFASTTCVSNEEQVTIKASRVLDGTGRVLTDVGLVIKGSKVERIVSAPQTATYDLTDLTVMPGWIETHAHISKHFDRTTGRFADGQGESSAESTLHTIANLQQLLMNGFTTVQSPGESSDKLFREWIAEGRIAGPRIRTSLGAIENAIGEPPRTPEELRQLVRKFVAEGADVIKLIATTSVREGGVQTMSLEQLQAACGEASRLGKVSMVHAQGPEGADAAVRAGCGTIEHGSRIRDETLDLMLSKGVYFGSHNHLLFHNYFENRHRFIGIGNWTEAGYRHMEAALMSGNRTFKQAIAKGVKVVFGTDATAGSLANSYEEMVFRVHDGGQAPMDVIVSATSLAAESMKLDKQIGTIASGFEADIIATRGDPSVDITAVRRVEFVMKGGKVYKSLPDRSFCKCAPLP